MDSISRIKEYIKENFSNWVKIDYPEFDEKIDFRKDWSELYKINDEEIMRVCQNGHILFLLPPLPCLPHNSLFTAAMLLISYKMIYWALNSLYKLV